MESEGQMTLPLGVDPAPPEGEYHMAVDVSTLSDAPSGVICSLAWIVFNPKDTGGCNDSYFKTVDWNQQERTYNWPKIQQWLTTSGMARRAIVSLTPPVPLSAAIDSLTGAYNKYRCKAIWSGRKVLSTIEDAVRYHKKAPPWLPGCARDLAAVWSTAMDMGVVADLDRGPTEPEDVPMGNAAFVTRAVRALYQAKSGSMPLDDHPI